MRACLFNHYPCTLVLLCATDCLQVIRPAFIHSCSWPCHVCVLHRVEVPQQQALDLIAIKGHLGSLSLDKMAKEQNYDLRYAMLNAYVYIRQLFLNQKQQTFE